MALPRFWMQVLRLRGFVILLGTPLVFLPLGLGTKEGACAYVIIVMAVYWCTETLPMAVTAMLPIVLFPTLGVMEARKVCLEYLKDTNMLFVGGLMVALAVEQWNLHKRIALKVLLYLGVRPPLLMLGFMGVTAFLSMWISNTATTAMMVPIVQAILDQLYADPDISQQRTTPQKPLRKRGKLPSTLSKNEVLPLEIVAAEDEPKDQTVPRMEGKTVPRMEGKTMPRMEGKMVPRMDGKTMPRMEGKTVPRMEGKTEGKTEAKMETNPEKVAISKALLLCVCYSASIGGTATLTGTGPNLVLMGQMSQLFPESGDVINFASWFAFAFPMMILLLILAWFWLQILFMGCSLQKLWSLGAAQTEQEKAARNILMEEYNRLGSLRFGEGFVLSLFGLMVMLWFTRDPRFVPGWASYVFEDKANYISDATVAVFVSVLLFIFPAKIPYYLRVWRICDTGPGPALLTWEVVQQKFPWNIVLVLGGGFALAKGSQVSGLSKWLGNQMTPLEDTPPWAIAVIICILIATFTECTSNVATATLFLPILASLAKTIQLNPLYVMIPCTLSASFAFMLPVATPPNAIVFSYGYLKVADMAKAGFMLNVFGLFCVTLAINTWGRAIFSLDTFPAWANVSALP